MDSGPSPWTAWYSAWLSLNIHLHKLFVDGACTFEDEQPRFHRVVAPTRAELQRLLRAIATGPHTGRKALTLRTVASDRLTHRRMARCSLAHRRLAGD